MCTQQAQLLILIQLCVCIFDLHVHVCTHLGALTSAVAFHSSIVLQGVITLNAAVFLGLSANCAFGNVELCEIDPLHWSGLQVQTHSQLSTQKRSIFILLYLFLIDIIYNNPLSVSTSISTSHPPRFLHFHFMFWLDWSPPLVFLPLSPNVSHIIISYPYTSRQPIDRWTVMHLIVLLPFYFHHLFPSITSAAAQFWMFVYIIFRLYT